MPGWKPTRRRLFGCDGLLGELDVSCATALPTQPPIGSRIGNKYRTAKYQPEPDSLDPVVVPTPLGFNVCSVAMRTGTRAENNCNFAKLAEERSRFPPLPRTSLLRHSTEEVFADDSVRVVGYGHVTKTRTVGLRKQHLVRRTSSRESFGSGVVPQRTPIVTSLLDRPR